MKKRFEKLVRDRIPEIIDQNGQKCCTTYVTGDELNQALKEKLVEEASEVANAFDKELITELADILEVIDALCKLNQINQETLNQIRAEKNRQRGSFDQGIFLHWVTD